MENSERNQLVATEESKRVGREIQNYLAASGRTRAQFAKDIKKGKGTVDKLCSGRYSEKTLAAVFARTKFVRSNDYSSDMLGRYPMSSWTNYIGDYIMIEPTYPNDGSVSVHQVCILWVDGVLPGLPGLVMYDGFQDAVERIDADKRGEGGKHFEIGKIAIPHERTSLIYIKGKSEGLYLAVSTMIGERRMRGLKMGVEHVAANAYAPAVSPVSIIYAEREFKDRFPRSAIVRQNDSRINFLREELDKVVSKQYGIIV